MRGLSVGVLMVLQLAACDRPNTVPVPVERPMNAAKEQQARQTDAPLTVVIEPAKATVETDLTAVANDTTVTYTWSVNGQTLEGASGRALSKTMFRRSDTVLVEVTMDKQHAHGETTIHNSPPRAVEVSLDRPIGLLHQGIDVRAIPKGVDPDGDDIQWDYQWIRNDEAMVGETSEVLRGDRYRRGDRVTVRVTPSDDELRGEPYTPLAVTISNGAPQFVSRPPTHTGGAEYHYQIQAVDPEGDQTSYRLGKAPGGMTVDSLTGALRWPLIGVSPGRQSVEIDIDDGQGGTASQTFELEISPPEG